MNGGELLVHDRRWWKNAETITSRAELSGTGDAVDDTAEDDRRIPGGRDQSDDHAQ